MSRFINFFVKARSFILYLSNNFDLIFILKLFFIVIKKDYSKYPKYVKNFEDNFAETFDKKYCLTFSSGTAAFYASLTSLNLKKNSKVLISLLTFPTVIEVLKMKGFQIYFFDLNRNFKINENIIKKYKYDLLVVTHPFGFYLDYKILKKYLKNDCKIIFDSSHSQGIKIGNTNHMKFSDISFVSMQGNKSISGGEGGAILTNNQDLYLNMINNHHPGHKKNKMLKTAGGIRNLKLRIHPLAALLAHNDLKTFNQRNSILINKVKLIYSYLDELKILHPYSDESNIGGFHYGLPFFTKRKIKSKIITKYNWYFDLKLNGIMPISKNKDKNIFQEMHFIDLEWIKKNDIIKIKNSLKKLLTYDY